MKPDQFEHLLRLDQPEETIRQSRLLLSQPTTDNERASLLVGMHVSLVQLGRPDQAEQVLKEIKALHLTDLDTSLHADFCEATFLVHKGLAQEGVAAFGGMLDRYRDALSDPSYRYLYEDIQWRRAISLVDQSRFAEALPILQEVVSFSFDGQGDEQVTHFCLAVCLEDAKDHAAAEMEFTRVINFNLKNVLEEQALYRLALLRYSRGAYAQAIQQLETVLQLFPGQSAVPRSQVYKGLSQCYRELGDSENERLYGTLAKKA